MAESKPRCKNLVLDAGPLLSLSPLRGLAETYLTVPQVLDELKDKRAREHFERLGLSAGVRVEVRNPDPPSLSHGQLRSRALLVAYLPTRQSYNLRRRPEIMLSCLTQTFAFWL